MGFCRVGLGLFLGLCIAGCNKSDSGASAASDAPGSSAAPAGGSAAPASKAKAGYATGRVYGEGGKTITAPGAKIQISLFGVSGKSGEKVYYTPKVNPDGTYQQKLVDGSYRFSPATINVSFDGKHYLIPLEPVGDDAQTDRESDKGIVQDFVWKLHGLRAGQDADEAKFTNWYGASVTAQFQSYREDTKKSVKAGPAGTRCVFTLTPKGKLIDGSEGKPLTFTREYDPLLTGLKNSNLPDIPIGVYEMSGLEIAPDGAKKPLLIQQAFAKFGPSKEVHFEPGASTGAWPCQVGFTRDE
jgi:hypothetical protein